MIREDLGAKRLIKNAGLVLPVTYEPRVYVEPVVLQGLSPVARRVFYELQPGLNARYISPHQPEIIALRLLDFFSSKQGYVRRKGRTFRNARFYRQALPLLLQPIEASQPIVLSSLCLCTPLANTKYGGTSPYPHMASYIALENLQKIAKAAHKIYPPGIRFILGFEGNLFRPLYFRNETVVQGTFAILRELNSSAYRRVSGQTAPNPVEIVDAVWIIEQTFSSYHAFLKEVEKQKHYVDARLLEEWQAWYRRTVSAIYFPSKAAQNQFIEEKAKWREAVRYLKYAGGRHGKGFMRFAEGVIPFTVTGRHTDMLALQLVPRSSYLPHQRVTVYDPQTERWKMMAYCDIKEAETLYAPRFMLDYSYPFYFEKLNG